MPDFGAETERLPDGTVVVALRGDADYDTREELAAVLADALALSPTALVVDLTGLTFLDSSGVVCLLRACRSVSTSIRGAESQPLERLTTHGILEHLTGTTPSGLTDAPGPPLTEPPVPDSSVLRSRSIGT